MKKILKLTIAAAAALVLSGCSGQPQKEIPEDMVLPDYSYLLHGEYIQRPTLEENEEYELPVRVYMDNTGSMQAFIFDENMSCNADPKFVRLMRGFRDMERTYYETCYYTIQQNEQTGGIRDWLEYGSGIYNDFQKPEFYFSWTKNNADGNMNGPLSMLYLEDGGLDPKHINVVMTDLAEQNVNNTQLAQEIQKMCLENDCEAYLFAFRFEYHGNAQVANPNKMNDIIEKQVDGPRPYYVIITGPVNHVRKYLDGFLNCLEGHQLFEGTDFYLASSKLDWNDNLLASEDIIFSETATYEDIKNEGKTGIPSELSKNLQRRIKPGHMPGEEPDDVFSFFYEKTEGVSRKQNDWRLNFWIPLEEYDNPNFRYKIEANCYYLELVEAEQETSGDENQDPTEELLENESSEESAPTVLYEWREAPRPRFVMNVDQVSMDEMNGQEAYRISMSGVPDKDLESDIALVIFTVTREETMSYSVPAWLDTFDSGSGDDYFEKTYNLSGFYDVLFGYRNLRAENGNITSTLTYAEIPILLTGLKGGK